MNNPVIRTNGLSKHYGRTAAVSDLTWQAPAGTVYGLLGHNGAGKSTTFKMLLGIVRPTRGSGEVLGRDIVRDSLDVRRLVAFVPEDKSLDDGLRVDGFLRFYASFFPGDVAAGARDLLARWSVPADARIRQLSKGTRAKVLLAAVFARNSRVILFDEPTDGLDPVAVHDLGRLLRDWASQGERLAVVASHRLDEVERMCDRVLLMRRGTLILDLPLAELKARYEGMALHDIYLALDAQHGVEA